jgi:hypothetical protein
MLRAGVECLAHWPEKALIFADRGCCMFSCVDCSKPEASVLYHDFSADEDVFALEALSLDAWFRRGLEPWRNWGAAPRIRFDEFEPAQAIVDMTDEEGKDSDDAVLP